MKINFCDNVSIKDAKNPAVITVSKDQINELCLCEFEDIDFESFEFESFAFANFAFESFVFEKGSF